MATRKKAKGKTKAKRKKTPVKAAIRRKTTTARKASAKKAPAGAHQPRKPEADREDCGQTDAGQPADTARIRRAKPSLPAQSAPPGERIGVVTHYYSHLSVATLRLESGTLRVGDVIHVCGHTTDFGQRVESLEVDHAPATEVGPNDEFGLKVVGHAREHNVVYKVRP